MCGGGGVGGDRKLLWLQSAGVLEAVDSSVASPFLSVVGAAALGLAGRDWVEYILRLSSEMEDFACGHLSSMVESLGVSALERLGNGELYGSRFDVECVVHRVPICVGDVTDGRTASVGHEVSVAAGLSSEAALPGAVLRKLLVKSLVVATSSGSSAVQVVSPIASLGEMEGSGGRRHRDGSRQSRPHSPRKWWRRKPRPQPLGIAVWNAGSIMNKGGGLEAAVEHFEDLEPALGRLDILGVTELATPAANVGVLEVLTSSEDWTWMGFCLTEEGGVGTGLGWWVRKTVKNAQHIKRWSDESISVLKIRAGSTDLYLGLTYVSHRGDRAKITDRHLEILTRVRQKGRGYYLAMGDFNARMGDRGGREGPRQVVDKVIKYKASWERLLGAGLFVPHGEQDENGALVWGAADSGSRPQARTTVDYMMLEEQMQDLLVAAGMTGVDSGRGWLGSDHALLFVVVKGAESQDPRSFNRRAGHRGATRIRTWRAARPPASSPAWMRLGAIFEETAAESEGSSFDQLSGQVHRACVSWMETLPDDESGSSPLGVQRIPVQVSLARAAFKSLCLPPRSDGMSSDCLWGKTSTSWT